MTTFVVDTNVAIVANGRSTQADEQCRRCCARMLETVVAREMVAIDDYGSILAEYARYLRRYGQPGLGYVFFKHVFNFQYDHKRVQRVPLTPADDQRGFEELPPNTFDRSDRKFLAVAVVVGGVVLNATDSDWAEHQALTDALGVRVHQLCPQHATK